MAAIANMLGGIVGVVLFAPLGSFKGGGLGYALVVGFGAGIGTLAATIATELVLESSSGDRTGSGGGREKEQGDQDMERSRSHRAALRISQAFTARHDYA